jgi:hypothetical protein
VAEKILPGLVPGMTPDQAMIWFGVIIAMNLQTSFLTPPFGFALFYLRSVAAKFDYKDRVTGQNIKAVTTNEIYKGSIAFIILQIIMVAAIMIYPSLVTGGIKASSTLSAEQVMEQLQMPETGEEALDADLAPAEPDAGADTEVDPLKDLMESTEKESKAK